MAPIDPRLSAWESYYVIVGSSGAALIGLQFVVITLIAGMRRRTDAGALSAFGTPTVVHFTGALLVSAIMSAPWSSLVPATVALALCGLGGLAYGAVVVGRARSQADYQPVWEDWLWFTILPFTVYAVLALGALLLRVAAAPALFLIGAAALGLLFIGIHNSWDTVTHLVVNSPQRDDGGDTRRAAQDEGARQAEIQRSGSQPSGKGPSDWFTGTVRIDPLFPAREPARAVGASVTFEPGARTAWHSHPLGQTLIVTAGCGRVQRCGGPIEEIRPGDVIWLAPGEKHWHGATPTTAMTHIAIQEQLDGKTADWMEPVGDGQYSA